MYLRFLKTKIEEWYSTLIDLLIWEFDWCETLQPLQLVETVAPNLRESNYVPSEKISNSFITFISC